MLEALRISGGFTYTIYSLGGPADIASNGGTYTEAAERALDSAQGNVDVIGQGTWRVNSDRCVCLKLSLVWVHGWLALWRCASAHVHVYDSLARVVWCLASVLYRMALTVSSNLDCLWGSSTVPSNLDCLLECSTCSMFAARGAA